MNSKSTNNTLLWRSTKSYKFRLRLGTVGTGINCDYLIWCIYCTVVVLTCFVIRVCVCVGGGGGGGCNVWVS